MKTKTDKALEKEARKLLGSFICTRIGWMPGAIVRYAKRHGKREYKRGFDDGLAEGAFIQMFINESENKKAKK